jgi:hypothetical protein
LTLAGTVRLANWPEHSLHFEDYSAAEKLFDPKNEHGFEAELTDSELTLSARPAQTLHQALIYTDRDIACDGKESLCGLCEAVQRYVTLQFI